MMTLVIRQKRIDGATKTWRLKPDEGSKSFGSSRLADLNSIAPESAGIEGIFEYRNGFWSYTDLSRNFSNISSHAQNIQDLNGGKIKCSTYELEFSTHNVEHDIFDKIEKSTFSLGDVNENSPKEKLFQLFLIKRGGKVLENGILPFGKNFTSKVLGADERIIVPVRTSNWIQVEKNGFEVKQKTLLLENVEELSKITIPELMDQESRKGARVMGGITIVVLLLAFLIPKNPPTNEIPITRPNSTPVVIKTVIKNPRQKQTKPQVAQQNLPQINKNLNLERKSEAKVIQTTGLLKSFTQGRFSKLLSKVSAQAARSANIVVSHGISAGSGPSGVALSALGNVDRSGRDWSNDAKGTEVKISTGGRGGGHSTNGLGGLSKGGTGSAGVGLIEDESEVSGGLDRDVIAQYIKGQLGQILYCYERQLSAHPDLFGKVSVRFTIGAAGTIDSQIINDTTLKNATVEGCILKKVAAWKFPAPQGGTKVMVTYPFLFKSTN